MTDKLPPQLLALFAPRPPLRWVQHVDQAPEQRRTAGIDSIADYLPALKAYKDNDGFVPTESWLQRRDRKKLEAKAAREKLLTEGPKDYKPDEDPNIRGDAFKTLVVARLSYEANEGDLEREFGRFGPIERIRIIKDTHAHEKPNKKKKPHRGYAFVVFEREKDMRAALDGCDGIRIKDRRIKVDVERGRTVKGWKPRRLGGGLGGRGYTKAVGPRPSGPGGFGGGFGGRDGFRGGFQGGRGRGGFGGGRGGDRGFGGRGGGFGGGRDRGFGQQNGYGAPPPNAPAGPGFGGRDRDRDRNGPSGGYDRGGRSYDDRSGRDGGRFGGDRDRRGGGGGGGGSNANYEPVRGDRDRGRDFDRPREDDRFDSRKRGFDGGYEDPRKLRRY
ncbi:hypothetical protein JX265_001816 [Neoarthrinium moseri]|uniref:RRM domain-containing protein n=1 Tax=Neoarthrinium moseri TaxID=1658444 RepID=A0A9P9WVV4_9PEZI|nr:hypothetical protein JX265_001816 [Neoarthrinium moseri]